MKLLKGVPFLSNLVPSDLEKLANAMTPRVFHTGDVFIKKGEMGDTFFLIQEGSVIAKDISVGSTTYEDITTGAGGYFGERSIATAEPTVANVKALTDGTAFTIDRNTFQKVLGAISDLVLQAQDGRKLCGIKVLKDIGLTEQQCYSLSKLMTDSEFIEGKKIMERNVKTRAALYFVRQGKIEVEHSDGRKVVVEKDGYFGEETFHLDTNFKSASTIAPFTVTVLENCVCGVLTLAECKDHVDVHLLPGQLYEQDEVPEHSVKKEPSLLDLTQEETDLFRLKSNADLADLKKHKILGEGTFGQVWLVSETLENGSIQPYALKIQSKHDLAEEGQIKSVIAEKEIMMKTHHPFAINLIKTYQDTDFIYMLVELIQGGELFSVMHGSNEGDDDGDQQKHGLVEHQAKFYALCIADVLAYLHRNKYVYRDLKSENVMIDSRGYPVLIDFGFAKYVPDKTYTLCGTPAFLSPEVILTRGHNQATDHWSLGILIYEMITGENPFFFEGMDQMSLFQSIVEEDFDPPAGASPEASDLVSKLLIKDPAVRLGSLANGERDILRHVWFDELDLHAMRRREVPAPWVPEIKDPLDTSCFDDWSHLEDKTSTRYGSLSPKDAALFEGF